MNHWTTGVIRFTALLCSEGWLIEGFINGSDPVLSYTAPKEHPLERVIDSSRYRSLELLKQWYEATVNTEPFRI